MDYKERTKLYKPKKNYPWLFDATLISACCTLCQPAWQFFASGGRFFEFQVWSYCIRLNALGVMLLLEDLPSQRNPWYCAWQWHLKPLSVSTQSPPCWQGLGLQWSSSEGWKVTTIDLMHRLVGSSWPAGQLISFSFFFTLRSVSTKECIRHNCLFTYRRSMFLCTLTDRRT